MNKLVVVGFSSTLQLIALVVLILRLVIPQLGGEAIVVAIILLVASDAFAASLLVSWFRGRPRRDQA